MYNILEQILPTEITMKVMIYSRHPVADIMKPHHEKHEKNMIRYREICDGAGKDKKEGELRVAPLPGEVHDKGQQGG